MKTTTGPHKDVLGQLLAEFDYEKAQAAHKAACQSKYGLKPVPGKNVPYFTPKQLSDYLRVSTKTLERWRKDGKGPASKKVMNKRIRYYIADVEAWLDQKNGVAGDT